MSNQAPEPDPGEDIDDPRYDDVDERTWRDAVPFFIAAAFVVVVVGAIALVAIISPPGERLNDSTRVQYVVNDAFTARNSLNYQQYSNSFCERDRVSPEFPSMDAFLEANRSERDTKGNIEVPDMDVTVDGDVAHVKVNWQREKDPADKGVTEWTVIRQGEDWKVCNS